MEVWFFQIKFCGKNPALRVAGNRQALLKKSMKEPPFGKHLFEQVETKIFKKCNSNTLDFLSKNSQYQNKLNRIEEMCSYLSSMSECFWGCQNSDDHIKEYLLAQACDTIYSIWRLFPYGHYDSCFSLMRGIMETINLFYLFSISRDEFNNWNTLDQSKVRIEYAPEKVRKKIEENEMTLPIKREVYWMFCERFVHPNPKTRPQLHSNLDRPIASGFFQVDGLVKLIDNLENLCILLTHSSILTIGANMELQVRLTRLIKNEPTMPNRH